MSRFAVLALVFTCACTSSPMDDVTGPYTGPISRYAVDAITFPLNSAGTHALADDLDGDTTVDNEFGGLTATLFTFGDLTTHGRDMMAAGALTSLVELQADDPQDDDTAAAWYVGADGDPATAVGGVLRDGAFVGNRTRTTRVPGRARLRLPIFVDADPISIDLYGMELDLTPDGHGGLDGLVRGGFHGDEAMEVAYDGVLAMIAAAPQDHRAFWRMIDANYDGVVTRDEFARSTGIMAAVLTPDVELDGVPMISVGFGIHLAPCPGGQCPTPAVADRCHDRTLDGDETAMDCGGSCSPCAGDAGCAIPADCQSGSCTAGRCSAPTCTDGHQDGFEADTDCGGACTACANGQRCVFDHDCAAGHCVDGRCGPYPG